ncbi:mucin-17 isoform X2 [Zootermopsis nevadensis]|uniref:mucin-17 isoform X2 n=1 Tax=Zootermopsis nevadensis TaxID=136037 RepID=UPI000B8ECA65|nr:mucin-17 isoform X2 [Zootermopsis nevadensis]
MCRQIHLSWYIQSWWEVPSIAHFCSLFRAAFNLLDFDIEELEEALLTDGAEDSGSSLLQELIVRLLCGCLGNNDISTFNYQMFLRRLFRQKCQEYGRDNPFNTDIDFQFLPLRTKVEILHALCDFRLDADDVQDLLKNLESDSLRVEPLGYDENNSAYWYFYGTRLYREDYPKVKKAKEKRHRRKEEKRRKKRGKSPPFDSESDDKGSGIWQVVCFSEQDWDKITEGFRDSTSKNERALFHTLAEDFLPEIPRLFAEKERLQRKRLLEYQPRRQSSRLEKLKQQKEEEEKILQREEDERLQQESVKKQRLQQQEILKKRENRALMVKDRATRALRRSLSRTNSECGSTGSIPDSLTDNRSNRSSTFVGRQTNNSLSSATGQIVIQGLKQKLRSSQVFKQTEEDLQTGMYKILEHIKNHDDAWPFADPVDEDYAPRYYSIIRQPMDLQRMEDKLDDGEYLTFADFKADFQLIVDNCRQYNGTGNEYTEMVGNLQEAFQMAVERYLESDPSSDEEVAVEFPTGASSESRTETQGHRHKHHRARRKREKSRQSSHINRNAPSPESEHTLQSSTAEEREDMPAAVTREKDQEDKIDHLGEGSVDTDGSSTKDDATEPKRPHSHNGTKRRKKTGVIKNVAEIEALELATEQTLKDINKWLDDTPRFSEFSSASNSPSHLIGAEEYEVVGSRIESEYRRSLKLDRPPSRTSSRSNKDGKDLINKRRSIKDSTKQHQQRRREIQRTIERLQPGKSKGNLISNIQSANKAADDVGGCSGLLGLGGKPKENRNSLLVKADEAMPKLSLGTVLTSDVLGFGVTGRNSHNFNSSEGTPVEDKKPAVLLSGSEETGSSPGDIHNKLSPEKQKQLLPGGSQSPGIKKEDEKTTAEEGQSNSKNIKQEKVTPNLSAWFKAFGAPKTTVIQKQRKPEVSAQQDVDTYTEERKLETVHSPSPVPADVPSCSGTQVVSDMGLRPPVQEDLDKKTDDAPSSPTQQSIAPAQRQRKVSTGSSMSERSSFSQDPMDPLDGYPAPYPSPLHRSPMAASPVMASPRPEDTPKPTASYPPLNGTIRVGFYQDISFSLQKSSPEKSNSSCSPQSPSPFHQQPIYSPRYPPPHDTSGYLTYRNPAPGPPQTYDGLPVPPYSPVMQYYDTSKPLTDQYRAARTQASEEYIPGNLSLSYTSGQQQGYPSPTPASTSSLPYVADRQSGFQLSVPRPSSALQSPSVPATSSGFLGSLPYTSNQQQGYDISMPRPSALHKSGHSVVTSSVPFNTSQQQVYDISIPQPSSTSKISASAVTVPSTAPPFMSDRHQEYDTSVPRTSTTKVSGTAFPVKKRLYSDVESGSGLQLHHQTSSRLHPSPPSPVTTSSVTIQTPPPAGLSQPINLTPHTTGNRLTNSTLGNAQAGGRLDRTSPVNAPQAQYSALTEQVCTSPVSVPVSGPETPISQVSERLLPTSEQQTMPERIISNPITEADVAQHPDSVLQASEKPHQSTGPHVTDKLYSEEVMQPSERMHLTVTSPGGNHQTSSVSGLNIQQSIDSSHTSRLVSSKQPPADHLRQSPITVRVGNDITFHRGPFSPAAPSPMSNFTNLSHIVDRFPSDGSPFYTTGGDKNRIFGQGSVQPPISSAAAAMAMFSQPAPTISYNRSVPELSSVLSSKVSDVQSVYSRTMPELSSVLPGKSAPPISVRPPSYDRAVSELSNYGRQTMEMSTSLPNKATPPMEGQTSYNHSVADLPSVLTNKVPPATAINVATPTYSRPVVVTDFSVASTKVLPLVEASPLSVSAVTASKPKLSRKRKTKQVQQQQQVTCSSDTSVSSSSTTAFQQYVSEPSAIALKTVQTSVVPGSAFNFGPAASGLGLYGDGASFLDEYRSPPTGYYIPPGTEPGRDKQTPVPPAPTPFPFLGHPQPRPPTYPQLAPAFINHQPALMDASGATTPLYQQYLQRHQEELLRHSAASAPMVLHQGLLAPPSGYPPGYHPALGIRQPYDSLNRPSWL